MKKIFLVSALALFGAMNAQVKLGVKGGYSLSNLHEKDTEFSSKSSVYVGGLVEYKVTDKFALQGELLYSPLGATEKYRETFANYYAEFKAKATIHTLQIPLAAKFYPTKGLGLLAGFNVGFNLSGKMKTEVEHNLPAVLSSSIDLVEGKTDLEVKTLGLAPFIGAEYNLESGLFFDARYNLGVTNTLDYEGVKVHHRFFQVGLGYKF